MKQIIIVAEEAGITMMISYSYITTLPVITSDASGNVSDATIH